MILRPYQHTVVEDLWAWMTKHSVGNPIVEASVGAGKSLVIAAIAQRAELDYPGVRVLVLVHQKELLSQNLDKLHRMWPGVDVGIVSAALSRKQLGHQVTYATIGSIHKLALRIGRIDIIMADECHLINPKEAGMWRTFLKDLAKTCPHARVIGLTGTPFRGNGVWLTAGQDALFTHIAAQIKMTQLLEMGYLAPLVPATTNNRVEASGVRTSGDDYVVSELAKVTDTEALVAGTCDEIVELARGRKRWLVFAVTIQHAEHVRDALIARGVDAEVVSAATPKAERDRLISQLRTGKITCLVNVAVLTTGFDCPEVDFIALLRATKSPVLYVQIAGRGMRCVGQNIQESIANGKANCLWADFTSTTVDMGPVDEVQGRMPAPKGASEAPFKLCPNCGSQNAAGAARCTSCGHEFPPPEKVTHGAATNGAKVLSSGEPTTKRVRVTASYYSTHIGRDSNVPVMRVEHMDGIKVVAREWVCFDHSGFARRKAEAWWAARSQWAPPPTTKEAVEYAGGGGLLSPKALTITTGSKYPDIVAHHWQEETT